MHSMRQICVFVSCFVIALAALNMHLKALDKADEASLAASIVLPEGWSFSVYASGLAGPQRMQLAPNGDMLVSMPASGAIARLAADRNGDGKADEIAVLAEGLRSPHGLLLDNDQLYVAEEHQINRFRYDGVALADPQTIAGDLPVGGELSQRNLRRGPDGKIYVSVSASCNACEEKHPLAASFSVLESDGKLIVVARGLRSAMGFDWRPSDGMLYALDLGRTSLGDVIPPDELNLILEGEHYGWPYHYGLNVKDPEWGDRLPEMMDPIQPAYVFDAHASPLAIRFLAHANDPQLKATALVTKHGSDNPAVPAGHEIVSLHWHDDGRIEEQTFMSGCLKEGRILCRPVDLVEAPDGTLFVSDDHTGAIYRLAFAPKT
jgi:glucose/arabinose dehydrogenase